MNRDYYGAIPPPLERIVQPAPAKLQKTDGIDILDAHFDEAQRNEIHQKNWFYKSRQFRFSSKNDDAIVQPPIISHPNAGAKWSDDEDDAEEDLVDDDEQAEWEEGAEGKHIKEFFQ